MSQDEEDMELTSSKKEDSAIFFIFEYIYIYIDIYMSKYI